MKAERSQIHNMQERHQPAPKITIDEMMLIADKVAEETGHYPSYGEVFTGITCGRINPADYLRKGVRK